MAPINLTDIDRLPAVFTVAVTSSPPRAGGGIGEPVELASDTGLKVLCPLLGPSSVLLARLILDQPGRTWHIGDVAGHLGIGVEVAQRTIRRLAMFGWITAIEHDDGSITYHVLAASNLTRRQLDRLHPELAALYARHSGLVNASGPS